MELPQLTTLVNPNGWVGLYDAVLTGVSFILPNDFMPAYGPETGMVFVIGNIYIDFFKDHLGINLPCGTKIALIKKAET